MWARRRAGAAPAPCGLGGVAGTHTPAYPRRSVRVTEGHHRRVAAGHPGRVGAPLNGYVLRMRGAPDERQDLTTVDPVVEAYKRDLDLASLRQNLKRSVEERIAALVALQRLADEARRAGQQLRHQLRRRRASHP